MADYELRHDETAVGEFFTDDSCITCDQCFETAPSVFKLADDGMSVVYHQPETDEERALALDAMEECPVEAIGIISQPAKLAV